MPTSNVAASHPSLRSAVYRLPFSACKPCMCTWVCKLAPRQPVGPAFQDCQGSAPT